MDWLPPRMGGNTPFREEHKMMTRADVPAIYRRLYDRAMRGELSPRQAIRLNCIHCCGWQREEAKLCTAPGCPLYAYRPKAWRRLAPNEHRGKRGLAVESTQMVLG